MAHQRHNVSTDLVSPPEEVGLDRLVYGWRIRRQAGAAPLFAEISARVGRLEVFSSDGDLICLEAELGLSSRSHGPQQVNVAFNGRVLAPLDVGSGWTMHRLRVPASQVRVGRNVVELRTGYVPRPGGPPSVRLRRLRLLSRASRSLWLPRAAEIQAHVPRRGAAGPGSVLMPSASHLDTVLEVPAGARLAGRFELRPAGDSALDGAEVYVRLLDERRLETHLLRERPRGTRRVRRDLGADLSPWSGQLVRLRFGITGRTNALLEWQDVQVRSAARPTGSLPEPPIDEVVPGRSGRLGRPNVLVVLLDAARADAFSSFGGTHPTPAVERLARDGTAFLQALAPAPWTGQSVPALLTGLYADALGVDVWGSRLPDNVPTIAEIMRSSGYRTVLWSQHPIYWTSPGIARGFLSTFQSRQPPDASNGATPGIEQLAFGERPTFAFVHLMPPHHPYLPPAPHRGALSSWYQGAMAVDAESLGRYTLRRQRQMLTDDDVRYVRDRYQENVAFADSLLGKVLEVLDRQRRYTDTLIVLLSDHGEAFLEHGLFKHGPDVHREMLHVPLVVKWPASVQGFRRAVSAPVSLLDVVPTLVDGLALRAHGYAFQGHSLLPVAFDDGGGPRGFYALTRGVMLQPEFPPRPKYMLQTGGGWRLLYDPLAERSRLYRGDRDPLETRELAFEQPLRALLMRQSLLAQIARDEQLRQRWHASEAEPLDPESIRQLKTLGYLQ